nr:MAG TPA: hypothetical protein [Caudoviricetes sp.]
MSCKRLYNLRNTVRVVFTALSTRAFDCIGAFILPRRWFIRLNFYRRQSGKAGRLP